MAASVFAADPTLEKHPALAAALERIDQQAQDNLAKT
jgi:hypothetical protein